MSDSPYASVLAGDLTRRIARFDLVPLEPADAAALFRHLDEPAVVEFMGIDVPKGVEDARWIIDWARQVRAAGTGFRWAIRARDDGALVGTCGLHNLEGERGSRGEIGYDVGKPHWGERVMDEVMPAALDLGFGALGLRRIEAMVTAGNEPSCRLLERHGFAREGVLRDYGFWKGRFWDQIVYARLAAAPT